MSARQLIDGRSFGPDALKTIRDAFDVAWAEIAGGVSTDPVVVAATRLRLANAVLFVADEGSRDVEVLKQAALEAMSRMMP
jgi:hypothetical protein